MANQNSLKLLVKLVTSIPAPKHNICWSVLVFPSRATFHHLDLLDVESFPLPFVDQHEMHISDSYSRSEHQK